MYFEVLQRRRASEGLKIVPESPERVPREPPVDLGATYVYGRLEFARRTACLLGILQMNLSEAMRYYGRVQRRLLLSAPDVAVSSKSCSVPIAATNT